jgi:uncharacterized protein (DUF1697 family)
VARFAAMLRSINVGGRNRVAMADLRAVVSSLGFGDVATYLQSGNVVFSGTGPASAAGRAIEGRIAADLGVAVPVFVRSDRELRSVLARTPFADLEVDPRLLHVTFLVAPADPEAVRDLDGSSDAFGEDRSQVVGKEVYLYCPGGYGETKLSNAWIEHRLGRTATTRNWRTVTRLAEMVGIAAADR